MSSPKVDPAKGMQAAANEFAPTLIDDGGEGGAREVQPAPGPARQPPAAPAQEAPAQAEVPAREFVDYVNGELKAVADRLGYDIKLTKRNVIKGPVMFYDPDTLEGKVFGSPEEAPSHFLDGDALQARYALDRAKAAE